jgi:hypothetical protein
MAASNEVCFASLRLIASISVLVAMRYSKSQVRVVVRVQRVLGPLIGSRQNLMGRPDTWCFTAMNPGPGRSLTLVRRSTGSV